MKTPVSILRCTDYDPTGLKAAVKEAVRLIGGMEKFARPGERLLLKPNILAGKASDRAVTTHPEVVRAMIELVREAGAIPFVGDSSAIGGARKNAETCGILGVCEETGTDFVEFNTLVEVQNPNHLIFRRLELSKEVLAYDGIINLAKLKTHAQMYLTMAVKNLFGSVPGKRKARWHFSAGVDTTTFATMLLDLHNYLNPRLSIMDAVVAMEGNGPASGETRKTGLVLAADNAIAMDRVLVELVGARLKDTPISRAAMEHKLAGSDIDDIAVVGEALETVRIRDFKFPPPMDIDFAAKLPEFIRKRLKNSITTRPEIDARRCSLCNICVQLCPAEVMELKTRVVIDYQGCIRCYCCQESCPKGVISVKDGWLKKLLPGL